MVHIRYTNHAQEYLAPDLIAAVLLMADKYGISREKLASALNRTDKQMDHVFGDDASSGKAEVTGMFVQRVTPVAAMYARQASANFLNPVDCGILQRLFGKSAGIEGGFASPATLIYAAQQLPEAAGARWQRTDYPSNDEQLAERQDITLIKAYKKAATLLVEGLPDFKLRHACGEENQTAYRKITAYLNNSRASVSMSDTGRLQALKELTGFLAPALGKEELSLQEMLAEAKTRFPQEEFPAAEQVKKAGQRR